MEQYVYNNAVSSDPAKNTSLHDRIKANNDPCTLTFTWMFDHVPCLGSANTGISLEGRHEPKGCRETTIDSRDAKAQNAWGPFVVEFCIFGRHLRRGSVCDLSISRLEYLSIK